MCELLECPHFKACELATITVETSQDAFDPQLRAAKLRELKLTSDLFRLVADKCNGKNIDGKCGVDDIVGEARGLVFGAPMTPLSSSVEPTTGYR